MNVTAVTVTYGKRAHLLTQALDAARDEGIAHALVIDNASADDIAALLATRYGGWAHVHRLERNLGSAGGFKTGIDLALQHGAEFLLLLDDDNVLNPGAVNQLYTALNRQFALRESTISALKLDLPGLSPARHPGKIAPRPGRAIHPKPGARHPARTFRALWRPVLPPHLNPQNRPAARRFCPVRGRYRVHLSPAPRRRLPAADPGRRPDGS
jgi:glycosyltransferase involved in cell wall biosynthesis